MSAHRWLALLGTLLVTTACADGGEPRPDTPVTPDGVGGAGGQGGEGGAASASSAGGDEGGQGGQGGGEGGAGGQACDLSAPNACESAEELESIAGDGGSDTRTAKGATSKWFKILVTEPSFSSTNPSFTATLTSPPGTNFDLFAYEGDAAMTNCSKSPSKAFGEPEAFSASWTDTVGSDDDLWWVLEVRGVDGGACEGASWSLTVEGNTGP